MHALALAIVAVVVLMTSRAEATDSRDAVRQTTTSYLAHICIEDSTGAPRTGLVAATANLTVYYARADQGNAGATQIPLVTGTRGTWTSGGFVEKDATNMPGCYEVGIPNPAFAAGAPKLLVQFKGASNMKQAFLHVDLMASTAQDILARVPTALVGGRMDSHEGATIRRNVAGQRGFQVYITDAAGQSYLGAPGTVTVEVKKDAAGFGAVSAPGGGVGLTGGGSTGDGHFLYTPSASDIDCAACVFRFLVGGIVRSRVNVTTQP